MLFLLKSIQNHMTTVEAALNFIENSVTTCPAVHIPVPQLVGRILAADIVSPIDMPGFNQSAMDGYAVRIGDDKSSFMQVGEVQAGAAQSFTLKPGEAVRIFTGACVPDDADTVVQQEWTEVNGNEITVDRLIEIGKNIRPKGEQLKTGERALKKGTIITPAGVGFLAGLGITEVLAIPSPKIALITTGNELVQPGTPLKTGQIYESNGVMLTTALHDFGFTPSINKTVEDNYEHTKNSLAETLNKTDALIITGGISVGDYDFVKKALTEIGVEEIFYKISQKPGKPFFCGKKNKKMVFALPGNPAAALICYYIYVLPALQKMSGKAFEGLPQQKAKLTTDYTPKGTRALFLKANLNGNTVAIAPRQSSAMLDTFATANALIYIPDPTLEYAAGDEVTVYQL